MDYLAKNLRRKLENNFVGLNLTDALMMQISDSANTFLEVNSEMITSGNVTSVRVDNADPRQVNIKVDIIPLFPLNQINITILLSANL